MLEEVTPEVRALEVRGALAYREEQVSEHVFEELDPAPLCFDRG